MSRPAFRATIGRLDSPAALSFRAIVGVEPPLPRGIPAEQVQAILAAIPRDRLRDRVLFGLIASTGLRAGEALRIHIEDVDRTRGDERVSIIGKGQKRRTVLLDDPRLVTLIKRLVTVLGRTMARSSWPRRTASGAL